MLLFNREEEYIGKLKNIIEAKHYEELNGENTLNLTLVGNEIEKNYRIVYKDIYGIWHEFIVKGIEEEKTDNKIIKHIYCESSLYETLGDYIEDKRPSGEASMALAVALGPTRWETGIVDDLGSNNTSLYRISAMEGIQKVAKTWGGELRARVTVSGNKITGRYVDLFARRGNDLGKRFTYKKDIESIKKTVHRGDVITALYGYGKGEEIEETGGFGRRIDFSEINDGKAYVENNDARLIWGRNNPDGSKSHVFGKVEFDDIEDKEILKQLTEEKLQELSQPLITYEAKVIDLKAFGFEHEGVELGDSVRVIDRDFEPELRLYSRVVAIERNILSIDNQSLDNIVLGNFIPSILDVELEREQLFSNLRDKQSIWDRSNVIGNDGTIDAQYLSNLMSELNTKMNSLGGYVYLSDEGEGLITYNAPTKEEATMAIQLLGGSFRIAGNKLPNGEFEWSTFGDGNGFLADRFIGGILQGGQVKFDLTNGTFLIGNSVEDYKILFDGNNLKINLSDGRSLEDTLDENFTQISQEFDNIKSSIQIGGGNNLIKNSVGYGGLNYWELVNGEVEPTHNSTWILGGISKHGWRISNGEIYQIIDLSSNKDYTLSGKYIKSTPAGSLKIELYDIESEEIIETIVDEIDEFDGEFIHNFNVGDLRTVALHIKVENASTVNPIELTDLMLTQGRNYDYWSQAAGETYTLNVRMDGHGIRVYSADGLGSTVMSPKEFAGYYNNRKIFTLNGDTTEVMGLMIKEKGLFIPPVKFVQTSDSLDIVWTGR